MELTCIICPNSCRLRAEQTANGYEISGNQCRRGYDFALAECTEPKRMFTSTVRIRGADQSRLSVISSAEIPKERLFDCQKALKEVTVQAPIQCRDIVIPNICGTGADILATKTMGSKGVASDKEKILEAGSQNQVKQGAFGQDNLLLQNII